MNKYEARCETSSFFQYSIQCIKYVYHTKDIGYFNSWALGRKGTNRLIANTIMAKRIGGLANILPVPDRPQVQSITFQRAVGIRCIPKLLDYRDDSFNNFNLVAVDVCKIYLVY